MSSRPPKTEDFSSLYKLGTELGAGADSVVYECRNLSTSEKCAVKVIEKHKVDPELIEEEYSILNNLDHRNIIKGHGIYHLRDKIHIVMELVDGEELHEILNLCGGISEVDAIPMLHQLLSAVDYLHEKKICHRDIKPENILISDDGTLKLIDFGFAVNFSGTDGTIRGGVGTQAYTAPEVLIGMTYDKSVDMWSVGATAYTLLSGSKPFDYGPHQNQSDQPTPEQKSHQRAKILNGEYNFDDTVWNKISVQGKEFITTLLKVRPSDRISAKEALEHPWITSVEIDLTEFSYQWKINSRSRKEIARREKREKRATDRRSAIVEERPSLSASVDYGTHNKRTKSHHMKLSEHSSPSSFEITRHNRSNTPSYSTIRESDNEKPERIDRSDRIDRSERSDRLERLDRLDKERAERLERMERSERTERLRSSVYGGLERSSTVSNSIRDRSLRASAVITTSTRASRDRDRDSSLGSSSSSKYETKSDTPSTRYSSNLSASSNYSRKYI